VTAYDEIIYPGRVYPQTHPDNLATLATLFGMAPAPPERCRVLEVACGDAGNLIPMAYGLPDSEFVGFDLAERPIDSGKHAAARLDLANLTLHHLDLADFPADAGRFDYIIAHGLYSWIPASAREGLLALIAAHLAPQGVAFVSYNAYPGGYVRRMLWEMLKFHTDHLEDPRSRITEAQALAGLLTRGRTAHDDYTRLLDSQASRLSDREASFFFHDDLADINEPFYFHQFIERTAPHRLQYLAEAEFKTMSYGGITLEAARVLETMDPITREQYLDFVRCRRFRQTLLCHADVELDRRLTPERIEGLLLGNRIRVQLYEPNATAASTPGLEAAAGEGAPDDEKRLVQATLDVLTEVSPRRLRLDEVVALVRQRAAGEILARRGEKLLKQLVFGAARAGAVELHSHAPRLATVAGERPLASAVARQQLESGTVLSTLYHDTVKLDDKVGPRLLPLLDGAHTRADLIAALTDLDGDDASARAGTLERHLELLGKLALLVA